MNIIPPPITSNRPNDSGSLSLPQLPRVTKGDDAVALSVAKAEQTNLNSAIEKNNDFDSQRLQNMKSSALSAANYFPVSDVSFSIFKDTSGQYITRFTSLKDGSISYYPEPILVKNYASTQGRDISLFSTKV